MIELSADRVFWFSADHAAWSQRSDGGDPIRVDRAQLVGLSTDGVSVYFADASAIYKCPVAGCPGGAQKIAVRPLTIRALAVYDEFVYFAEGAGPASAILRIPK